MATIAVNTPTTPAVQIKVDGRRERSASSRRRILNAMVELIEKGEPSPTAESIANKAGVSLRTVFRHFDEMENLHIEIAALVFNKIRPMLEQPLVSTTWPEILFEAINRRAAFYETMAPFKTAMDVNRHRSEQVSAKHRRMAEISRDLLKGLLPEDIRAENHLFEVLDLLLSAESWQRLREQQGLSVEEAEQTIVASVKRLVNLDLN